MPFDVQGARKAGYSDDEIADHLAQATKFDAAGARKAGYSASDIIAHLNTSTVDRDAKRYVESTPAPVRAFTQGVALGAADELDAAGAYAQTAVGNALKRATGKPVDYTAREAYDAVQRYESGADQQWSRENPLAAVGLNFGGAMMTPGVGALGKFVAKGVEGGAGILGAGKAAALGRGALVGATTGALSGAALSEPGERTEGATRGALSGAAIGAGAQGVLGALESRAANASARAVERAKSYGETLKNVGVSTTLPQRMGRAAKGLEDLLKRFPITGQAMAGYQDRQVGQLVRAVGLKALEPIGEGIPADVRPGFDMVRYVDDALGKVYTKAADLVPSVPVDQALTDDLASIAARKTDLADSEAALFDRVISDRLNRLKDGASGQTIKKMHSELGSLQAEQARKGNTTLSNMFGDTRRALMDAVGRANPEADKLIRQADEGWSIYSIMNDAAAAASNRDGVFLPGQLNTQVGVAAKRMGSNMRGKGLGPMQDIATAASQTIPDSYGNPGTANTVALGSLGAGVVNAVNNPESVAPVAMATGVLAAAATPYMLAGRKVLERLPNNPSSAEIKAARVELQSLAAKDPRVAELLAELGARTTSAVNEQTQRSLTPGISVSVPALGYSYN